MRSRGLVAAPIQLPDWSPQLKILYNLPETPSSIRPTILFLPFWGGSAYTFTSVLDSLASTSPSTTTIAISYPGTGNTEHGVHDNDARDHSINSLMDKLLGILEIVQPRLIPSGKIILVAHSMSAKLAYELPHVLKTTPRYSHFKIESLLLLAPAPPTELVLPDEMQQQQLTAYSTFESARWTMANVLTHKTLPSAVLDGLARDAASMSEGAKRGWIELGMKHDCTPVLQNRNSGLTTAAPQPGLKVAVLVGSEDKVETVERVQKEVVELLVDVGWEVSMKIIDGVGHLLPVEAVDQVVQAVTGLLD